MSTKIFDYSPPSFLLSKGNKKLKTEDIENWEKENKINLPEDYRNFILATNGGSLRPYSIEITLNDEEITERIHVINYFIPLIQDNDSNTPKFCEVGVNSEEVRVLEIAKPLSDFEIVMLIDNNNIGKIFARAINSERTSINKREKFDLIPISNNFGQFILMLEEDITNSTYHPLWQSPSKEIQEEIKINQKKLITDGNNFELSDTA